MKKRSMKAFIGATCLAAIFAASPASAETPNVRVEINGVNIYSPANRLDLQTQTTYVDVAAYTTLVGKTYKYDKKKKTVTINGKTLKAKVYDGVPTAAIRDIAEATGGEQVSYKNRKAYVLDLPDGVVQVTPVVPGMGEHWAKPQDLPAGPIYGVYEGRLVFIEQMLSQEEFASGKTWTNIAGMRGLPSPSVEHSDIEFQPTGHEGFTNPHYDLHHYFTTHAEHLKFGPASPGTHEH
ncbi:hypothetical protein M3221_03175 [Domibacillus indicus]|uniref:hypothetical protein n=1 Tax=Domibacillus indicus TaxID=1437523 RepID=UPI00203DA39D|nr:hypothetical protein [Domibacillus indicus]MCM3787417.1 hypothetical protein [Domibacillus indicus]